MAKHAAKRRKLSHDSPTEPSNGHAFPADDSADDTNTRSETGGEESSLFDGSQDTGSGDDLEEAEEQSAADIDEGNLSDQSSVGDLEEDRSGKADTASNGSKSLNGVSGSAKKTSRNGGLPTKTYNGDGLMGTAYTAETYKSNIFKLQVDELLEQVTARQMRKQAILTKVLHSVKAMIEEIPDIPALAIDEAEKLLKQKHGVIVPFPQPRPATNANYQLSYAKPMHINAAGSFPLTTHTWDGEDTILDLVVTMPSSIFQEKDYLNHRYFYKRAYYLACIASGIKANPNHVFTCSFEHLHGNQLLPILVLKPKKGQSQVERKYRIVILPSVSESRFPASKLQPMKNCVRHNPGAESDQRVGLTPTPFYNATLRSDTLVTSYLKVQHDALRTCDAYRETCILGRIWLRQRGISSRINGGGFGNFEWATMVALLLTAGGSKGLPAFSSGYSSYQLFKAALQYLATKDLSKNPHIVGTGAAEVGKPDGPVLFDAARGINLLFKMTSWSWKLLQHEARTTLAALSDPISDHFDATFIAKTDHPLYRYDHLIEIPVPALISDDAARAMEDTLVSRSRDLYLMLSRGLGDRVKLIGVHLPEERSWALDKLSGPLDTNSVITIGLMIDPINAYRTIDHGPSAEAKKDAAAFRKFWGEKAELRRFRDGSILESLVWSEKNESRSTLEQIVDYILNRHAGEKVAQSAGFIGDRYLQLLSPDPGSAQASVSPFQPVMTAFQALEQDLRNLEDVPLQLRHVLATDPQLSYTSAQTPFIPGRSIMHKPANVILQFEGSNRWPDDLSAIQRTKMAFLLKIAELLSESVEGVSARVGLENQDTTLFNQSFLDVIYPSGAAFRIRIQHEREIVLLERRQKDRALTQPEKTATAGALSNYRRIFQHEPTQTQALQTLCTRFPALSASVRLVKKWFASHRLSPHFAPGLIELFALRAFTDPYPWPAPTSATTGFLRALLFLSRWDWRNEPLIVDLGTGPSGNSVNGTASANAMTAADVAAIRTRYEAWRKIDPALNRVVLFAASNLDPDGTTWTDHARPAKVVAGRMTALAQATVRAGKTQGSAVDLESLFVSRLADYEVVLHLDPKISKRQRRLGKASSREGLYKNLTLQSHSAAVQDGVIGYDPALLLLEDLQSTYGDAMIFFFDEDKEDVIAGLWDPSTENRAWKIRLGHSTVPAKARGAQEEVISTNANKEAIINEISRIGGDLIKSIEWR